MFFDSKAREERRGEGGELASSHERRKRRFDRNSKFSLENFLSDSIRIEVFFFFFSSCLNFRRQFIYLVSRLAIFSPTLSHRLINVYFRDKKNSILECKNIGFRRVERSSILLFRYGNPTR